MLDAPIILRFGMVWMVQYGGNPLFPDFRVFPLDLGFVGSDVGQHTPFRPMPDIPAAASLLDETGGSVWLGAAPP